MARIALILALLFSITLAPRASASAPPEYSLELLTEWTVSQLDGYYRTLFALQGQEYETPLFTMVPAGDMVYTGCGSGKGTMLAFYCPVDHQIVFSEEFATKLFERDEFLPAYVISHEWAHHAQRLSGNLPVYAPSDGDWDEVFVIENELRADCMSGVWMRSVAERGYLNATDMSSVLLTATQIGDLGLAGRGTSHGTGEERLRAVFIGYEEGLIACASITPMPRDVSYIPYHGPH